jgi:hypothetical protein
MSVHITKAAEQATMKIPGSVSFASILRRSLFLLFLLFVSVRQAQDAPKSPLIAAVLSVVGSSLIWRIVRRPL